MLSLDHTRTRKPEGSRPYEKPLARRKRSRIGHHGIEKARICHRSLANALLGPWSKVTEPFCVCLRRLIWSSGKLLTTPSRLLKLIIPLNTVDKNSDRKDVEPLALLVHPQQPLSYLERLIQSELPSIKDKKGDEKVPAVHFKAEDSQQDALEPREKKRDETPEDMYEDAEDQMDETQFDGRTEKTGKLGGKSTASAAQLGEGGVESYSGLGHEGPSAEDGSRKFVRWSSSTEVGDFIRDAARGKEFAVEIEGAPKEIKIGVPSFNDRTHYLRLRLRKTAGKIIDLAAVKKECDLQAHKGAQRVAMGGAAVLVGYWYVVYRLTFETVSTNHHNPNPGSIDSGPRNRILVGIPWNQSR